MPPNRPTPRCYVVDTVCVVAVMVGASIRRASPDGRLLRLGAPNELLWARRRGPIVEHRFDEQRPQPRVLFFEFLDPHRNGQRNSPEPRFPSVKRADTEVMPMTQLGQIRARLVFSQHADDLIFGEFANVDHDTIHLFVRTVAEQFWRSIDIAATSQLKYVL